MIFQRITNLSVRLVVLATLLAPGVLLVSPQPAYAAPGSEGSAAAACEAIGGLTGADCDPKTNSKNDNKITSTITNIVNLLSLVVGVAAVIMIIVSGLKYVTSNGDSNKISGAKSTLLYAIIGLVVVTLAQFIVRFVITNATG